MDEREVCQNRRKMGRGEGLGIRAMLFMRCPKYAGTLNPLTSYFPFELIIIIIIFKLLLLSASRQ